MIPLTDEQLDKIMTTVEMRVNQLNGGHRHDPLKQIMKFKYRRGKGLLSGQARPSAKIFSVEDVEVIARVFAKLMFDSLNKAINSREDSDWEEKNPCFPM